MFQLVASGRKDPLYSLLLFLLVFVLSKYSLGHRVLMLYGIACPTLSTSFFFSFGTFHLINPVTQQLLHVWNKNTPQATAEGLEMDPWIKCTKSKFFPRVLEMKLGRISPSGCNIRYGIWRVDGSWTRLGQRRKNCFPKRSRAKSRLGRVLLGFRLCLPITLKPCHIPIPPLWARPQPLPNNSPCCLSWFQLDSFHLFSN